MKKFLYALLFMSSFLVASVALAQVPPPQSGTSIPPPQSGTTQTPVSPGSQLQYDVPNPLGVKSFCGLIQNLLTAAIQIGIPIAVLFIVWAGFKFVLARGSPDKLTEARKNFMWTLIGIAIFLGAWLIASVIANTVNQLGGNQQIISCR